MRKILRGLCIALVVMAWMTVDAAAQGVCWDDGSVQIAIAGTGNQVAEFGVDPTGTDCFDPTLDQTSPPPPPGGVPTEIYFQLDPSCAYPTQVITDIRGDVLCGGTCEWELHVEDTGVAVQVDLQWAGAPIDPLPACLDHLWLRQWPTDFDAGAGRWVLDTSGAPLGEVDMLAVNTYTYAKGDFFDHSGFTIALECSVPQGVPVAVDDAAATNEDTLVTIDVLANDTDPNPGDVLLVVGATDPPNGTATIGIGGGNVDYIPAPDFCGQDVFEYTVDDGHGNTDTAVLTVDVACHPDDPVAEDDTATVDEDSVDTPIAVLANDHDPDDGDTLTLIGSTPGAHGTTALHGDSVRYSPDPNYSGPDTFSYTEEDSTGRTDVGTVTVTVNGLPDPPVAADDEFTVPMNSGLNDLHVLANDVDPDPGDTLTIQSVGPPSPPGECPTIVNAGDHIKFSPCPGFFGTTTLTYIVEDSTGRTDVATVTIEIPEIPPELFFDDFETPDGWISTGQWSLQDEGFCCPEPMPSATHAWCFGRNGRFFWDGLLTSPPVDVLGYEEVDVSFMYCFEVTRAYGLHLSLEANVGDGWYAVSEDVLIVQGAWTRFGPATVTIPAGVGDMRLRLNLRSRFGWGCICIDNVRVTPVGAIQNEPPVAVAGDDQTPFVGANVQLDGSGSWDPDGDPLTFDWSFIDVPEGVAEPDLIGADTATPYFATASAGLYVLELVVDDGRGATDSDTITIDVQPLGDLLFFDNMESGINGWNGESPWALVNDPEPGAAPGSATHAWQYGRGLLSGTGALTSPAIDVTGQAAVSIQFAQFFHVEPYAWFSPAGTRGELQVQFNTAAGWETIGTWRHDDPNQDVWHATTPVAVDVPLGATRMRVRFWFTSRLARGGWWIDDVRVMAGGAAAALGYRTELGSDASLGGLQIDGVQNVPNPIRDVNTTRFEVLGVGIEEIRVQIFDLSGALVFDSGWQPNGYEWHLQSRDGETLANGVYLYVASARSAGGAVHICETKKLAVYR